MENKENSEWKPDEVFLDFLFENMSEEEYAGSIVYGDKTLTWDEVIGQIKEGTPFGRSYYEVLVQVTQESQDFKERFDKYKAMRMQ